jgi:hypothetical protein
MVDILCLIILIAGVVLFLVLCRPAGVFKSGRGYSGGHRSKSEAECIRALESVTGEKFPQAHPAWLKYRGRPLELDGYNERLKIALEFSGPLHTKWTPLYESYAKYYERIAKDAFKIARCAERRVTLIVVDLSLPRRHHSDYIRSRLQDAGFDYPVYNYILAQTPEVYRNRELEQTLKLKSEYLK